MPHSPLAAALALALVLAVPAPALAQAQDEWLPDLESLLIPTTTAASKRVQTAREAPATIVVLTRKDIEARGYMDLIDALRDLPGVSILHHVHAAFGASRLNFRGIPGNSKLVLLLNGRRIGFASAPHPDVILARDFPLAMVDRLEVVYGPASALYGADAMSAVVNIVTRDGNGGRAGEVSGGYGLQNAAQATLLYETPLEVDASLMLMGRFFRTDGEDFDRFPQFAASADDRAFWPGGASRDSTEASDAEMVSYRNRGFSLDFLRRNVNLPFSVASLDYRFAGTSEARWLSSVHTLNVGYEGLIGDFSSSTTLSYETYNINPNSMGWYNLRAAMAEPTDPSVRAAFSRLYNYGRSRGTRLEQTLIREVSRDLSLVGGVTVEDIEGVPQMFDLPQAPGGDHLDASGPEGANLHVVQYQNYALYMQAQLGYVPKLQTTIGARYDHNTRYQPTFNPRLGLVYAASEETTLKALFGTAYLAPTLFERYRTFGGPGRFSGFANPGLEPQTSRTFELSAIQSLGRDVTLTGSVYQSELFGLIKETQAPTRVIDGQETPGSWFANGDDSIARGAGLQLDAIAFGQRAFLSASLVDSKALKGPHAHGEEAVAGHPDRLSGIVGAMVKGGLTWQPLDNMRITPRVWWLSGFSTGEENPEFRGADIPGAWGLDLSARAQLSPRLAITLSGTNVLDQATYAPSFDPWYQGGKVAQPGRRLMLGVTYAF